MPMEQTANLNSHTNTMNKSVTTLAPVDGWTSNKCCKYRYRDYSLYFYWNNDIIKMLLKGE